MSNPTRKLQSRLGRGLEQLIPQASSFSAGRTLTMIPLEDITANPYQPRQHFNQEALESLSESIKEHGLNQPILVRRIEDHYELVAGERRFRASQMAGLESIPAIIKDFSDKESLQIALIENIERENLNPIEEAQAYCRLADEFNLSHEEIAQIFKRDRSTISNIMRLTNLPLKVQTSLKEGDITMGHARALLALENEDQMLMYLDLISVKKMNVRELEEQIRDEKQRGNGSPNMDQLTLFKDLESALVNKWEAPINIRGSRKKGRIVIRYTSEDEFNSIYQKLLTH